MADDPTGRPKPTPRRRRSARSTGSAVASTTSETSDGTLASAAIDADPTVAGTAPVEAAVAVEDAAATRADEASGATIWPMLDGRSPNEWVCPFLRSGDDRERLDPPVESPDATNRCAALEDVVPQSLRQQELVCLTTSHVNCPRYLRGAVVAVDPAEARARTTPTVTPAMLGALGLLAAAFTASVVFTFARGGLALPAAGVRPTSAPSGSAIAIVPTATPAATATIDVSAAPSVGVSPGPSVEPSPSANQTPTPSVEPSASPGSSASASPLPSSDRYALLTACPNKQDCWLYRVRVGDNLFSIARYFGVPMATVQALNPWTSSGLKVGRDLILPPPTR